MQGDAAAGRASEIARPWLAEHAFMATNEWSGPLQIVIYGLGDGPPATAPSAQSGAVWAGEVELAGYDLPAQIGRASCRERV